MPPSNQRTAAAEKTVWGAS